jgi:RNA polymerase sigma-70 factor, ECF subfamily
MLSRETIHKPAGHSEFTFGDDARMVAALRRGDEAAFEELVRKFGPRLLAAARRYLGSEDDACDALQDAFLCAFKAINTFKGDSQLSTWLHRIVINSALTQLRAKKRRLDDAPAPIQELLSRFDRGGNWIDGPSYVAPLHKSLEVAETRSLVRRCIDKLPDTYKVVLILRDINDLDTPEAASLLGLTANSVKVRLHRGRRALKTLIEREQALS